MARFSIDIRADTVFVFDDGEPILDADRVVLEWAKGRVPVLTVERPYSPRLTRPVTGLIHHPGCLLIREPEPSTDNPGIVPFRRDQDV